MKKSYTLVFLVCVILCLGLTVSLANKVENSGVNFEDGNVNLERGYIYLFESITLPRIEWGEVENYETNDNNAAKKYTTSNTHSIQDECLVNAIVVDRLGECRLGRWTTDSNGCFSFRTVLSYAPELWEMDKQDVRDVQLMYYSQTYTWHPKFSNYKEFLTGIKGFKFIQDKGKVQILCQLIDFNSDKKFTNGCFYIATQWVIVNDLKIKDKIKDETAGSCWIGDINKIKKQAEDDSEYAQWTLGNMYLYGVGVEKSPKLAMKWYQLAATNGFLKACYKVKDFTFVRLKESEVIKTKTLLKRAEQGDTEAQCAMGIAYASKLSNDNAKIYTIIGDGESQEGQIWEASMFAAHEKLDNLIVMLDYNKLQLCGYTDDVMSIHDPAKKWESFGFYVQSIDGNDVDAIDTAIINAKQNKGKPSMIVLNTIKGKGFSYSENAGIDNHSMPINAEVLQKAKEELK